MGLKLKELADSKELEGIRDINDESAEDFTRLVISLKRDANASVILNNLYKYTPMQTSFSCNIVALVDGVPRQLNLRDCLHYYVEHQIEVITKRSEFRRRKAAARAHVIEGLVKALNVIDEVIGAPILILPVANHDNNQHGKDENLRLQNLWDASRFMRRCLPACEGRAGIGLTARLVRHFVLPS